MIVDQKLNRQFVGVYLIDGDKEGTQLATTSKPNWFRRTMANLFFGLRWIDYPQPKPMKDIKPSKGVKASITKIIPKGRR
jgi:hypothetical protein